MALLNANMIAATSGTHPAPTPASKILRTAIIFNTILCYIFIPINASTYASNHHGYHALLPLQVTAFYAGFRLKYDSEERPLPCSLTEVILTGRSWVARATFEAFGLFILSLGLWALISGYTSSEGWSDGLDACGIIALILLSTNLLIHIYFTISTVALNGFPTQTRRIQRQVAQVILSRCPHCPHCQAVGSNTFASPLLTPVTSEKGSEYHDDIEEAIEIKLDPEQASYGVKTTPSS